MFQQAGFRFVARMFSFLVLLLFVFQQTYGQQKTVWKIGEADNSPVGFALAPDQFKRFLENDFGYEDNFFLIGQSDMQKNWPYVLPGPVNGWGGTGGTSGIRSHFLTVLFDIKSKPASGNWQLVVDVLDTDSLSAPFFKVSINGRSWGFQLAKGSGFKDPDKFQASPKEQLVNIEIPSELIKTGVNEIIMTTLQGGWLAFDQVKMEGPAQATLAVSGNALLRNVSAADYELNVGGKQVQPLLIDVTQLRGEPVIEVKLDNKLIFTQKIEKDRYILEAPMPAVTQSASGTFQVFADKQLIGSGKIERTKKKLKTPAGYVNTMLGAGHSRWMIAPGPWMPFSMVKLSPDNQNNGWQAGYDPTFESIGTFSHIHEWTMTGLGIFPTAGPLEIKIGDQNKPGEGYRSRIDKRSEEAPLGYYKVNLTDINITAELTATTRASFQKYTYNNSETGRIMVDLQIPTEYGYKLKNIKVDKVSANRVEGFSDQLSNDVWSGGIDQQYKVHFVIEFDQPIKNHGVWLNDEVKQQTNLLADSAKNAGMFFEFDTKANRVVQVRTGISYVSVENAALNLKTELSDPFGWDFDKVRENQEKVWNELLGRVAISSNDKREKERFYTNMYRSLASRNAFSDVDGSWRDADEVVNKFENKDDVALGCDAFWNTFWNLNQFWNLVTPEWSNRWVKSQLAMYDRGGWLAKGPAGMEYIPVMVAEHEVPLIVGAYQMGIRDYDVNKAYEAVHKMQTTTAEAVGGGRAGNEDLTTYLKHQYVPYDEGRFSNSLEYSFDDYTVSQFAKALNKKDDYKKFGERGQWWKNVIDPKTGFARMKDAKGNWLAEFDPFKSGANHHYVEGNAWQLTFFVPQDVPGLAKTMGESEFVKRLDWGFNESVKWRYNGPNDQYWDYPVVQGNQQSMHFAFLFNWVKKPWLTQKWSRSVVDRYYGHEVSNAYLGDEDQGQMSAWFVMTTLGLFQTDGGTRVDPIYEIGSPMFKKAVINLGEQFGRGKTFTIEAKNTSRKNVYVQSAMLNGQPLTNFWFKASDLLKGGSLVLEMGPTPNTKWGIGEFPKVD
ncbi:GH92 family glycosyl hydrolase [Dyadobacter fanqingshengii]|uniref:GH92 family glycosyl hydrolase n=1 Tax=Dyadobacter fanqingshengii TaxID=2906443 RepID=A0A9X1T9M6_9BACT|nr:GH92 family glycosyl hydrolase [Dyadobacter fanqingshengii]MCF0041465.1 GH92 family glycosyl hydrolase [Dyadobacter fanqingshengii]USJ36816.1 GH92 family glycosyl hydrolase [Dyadobacter fanqingshengii]